MEEQNIISLAEQRIFFNLISSSITYTNFESDIEYHLENDKVTIDYIKIPFEEIPDSLFNISNSQISNYLRKSLYILVLQHGSTYSNFGMTSPQC